MTEQLDIPTYWEIYPQSVRLSLSYFEQRIPLSVCGSGLTPQFISSNLVVSYVDDEGFLVSGMQIGNAMIMAWDSDARKSLRHLNVEVRQPSRLFARSGHQCASL